MSSITSQISDATSDGAPNGDSAPPLARTRIRPQSGWRWINVEELWRYRELLYCLAMRDIRVRYKQTVLGAAWAILQPVLMMLIFTAVLGRMAKVPTGGIPYPIFVYSGLLLWLFFSRGISAAGNSVVQSEQMVTKIYFPRLAIPIAAVAAAAVDFGVALSVLVVLMIYYQIPLGAGLLLAPLLVLLTGLAAMGAGALLAALNVSYRDFRHTLPFLVQLWMFATPSIYLDTTAPTADASSTAVSADDSDASTPTASSDRSAARWLDLNPLTGLVAAFRASMLGRPIAWGLLCYSTLATLVMFLAGCFYFRRVERTFADLI
jgi:lipopolysaccharide transport system permease protein